MFLTPVPSFLVPSMLPSALKQPLSNEGLMLVVLDVVIVDIIIIVDEQVGLDYDSVNSEIKSLVHNSLFVKKCITSTHDF